MRKFRLLLTLLLLLCTLAKAQDNTPYARYGIGELKNQGFAGTQGSADLTAAYNNQNGLNFNDPASFGFLRFTVFDIGGNISNSWLKTASSKSTFGSADPNYIALGFPIIRNHWGGGFGLSQYSSANYKVVQYNDSAAPLNSDKNTYTGTGGINQLYFATGAAFTHMIKDSTGKVVKEGGSFAIGIKAALLFGTINYTNTLEFVDTSNAFNTRVIQSRRVGGFLLSGGVQYSVPLGKKKNYHVIIGVDGNLSSSVSGKEDLLYERYRTNVALLDSPTIYDTVQQVSGQKGSIVIPMQIDGGITFSKDNNYSIGVQFHYGKWSEYRSFGEADSTTDNWKVSIGGEWKSGSKTSDSYFARIKYRAGFYYGTNYLKFSGNDFVNYGITLGVGLPVRRSLSALNLAFNIGQLGNVATNGQKETYFITTVGFSLADLWFLKRKYD